MGRWILVSGFRTKIGAQEFIDLLRASGSQSYAVYRVKKLRGAFIGLGQAGHPDGRGPLLEPLPNPTAYQD